MSLFDGDCSIGLIYYRTINKKFAFSESNTKEDEMPTKNNKVMYTNGLVNLKDFPRGELIEVKGNTEYYKVPEDVEVLTVWNNEFKWVHPESYSVHKDLKMLNVKIYKAGTIQCSNDHSIVTLDDNLNYIRTNPELGMVVPRLINGFDRFVNKDKLMDTIVDSGVKFKLNFDLGYLFGVIIGDGWVNHGVRLSDIMLATVENNIVSKIENVLKSYGYSGRAYTHSEEHEFDNGIYKHSKSTWNFKPVANLLRKYIGHKAINKELPEFWCRTRKGFRYGLLSGLIDTDGTIGVHKLTNSKKVAYSTTSQKLAYEISALVFSLGMTASVTISERKTGTIEYTVNIRIPSMKNHAKKLELNNIKKAERLKELVKELETKEEAIFAPTLSLDKLKELRNYLKNKEDNLQSIRVSRAIEKYDTSKSILKPFMLSIIESYPEFFEQNDFWKKYKSMVLDTNIEWLMIKEVTELKEITEAYDITCPPYCTFVMENGIVVYDTVSFNSVVTKESVREIDNLLASKSFYITPDGKLTYSAETDTLNYVLKHLSK